MIAVMMANVFIKLSCIAACLYMIDAGHNGWAVAFFILALLLGYDYEGKE